MYLTTPNTILEYMQTTIIKTEAANFVKITSTSFTKLLDMAVLGFLEACPKSPTTSLACLQLLTTTCYMFLV